MTYRKYLRRTNSIRAERQTADFTCTTPHGDVKGKAGDYIALDSNEDPYPISKEVFEATYRVRQ